jgi:hypothetical protein
MKSLRYLPALLGILCLTGTSAMATGTKTVRVTNSTSYTLTEVYASDVHNANWDTSTNLISGQSVAPGQQITVTIDDGTATCHYDVMGVLYGAAQHAYTYSVDACDGDLWTIN